MVVGMTGRPPFAHEIDGPGRSYFDAIVIDNILDALMELSAEVWTLRDRNLVLEQVLAGRGIAVSDAIEQHVPTPEEAAARKAAREAFVARVYSGFLRRPDRETTA